MAFSLVAGAEPMPPPLAESLLACVGVRGCRYDR